MARTSVKVDSAIYSQLCNTYAKRYGESPTAVVDALNQRFSQELEASKKNAKHSQKDLISDRTVREFFSKNLSSENSKKNLEGNGITQAPKLSLLNLNYLCKLMLGVSYQDALENKSLKGNVAIDSQQLHQSSLDHAVSQHGLMKLTPIESAIPDPADWLPAYREKLEDRYGLLRIPNRSESQRLSSVYVEARIAKEVLSRKKTDAELLAELAGEESKSSLITTAEEIFSTKTKVMILGRAGAGKTTLLKRVICENSIHPDKIPIFISLADYARNLKIDRDSLISALTQEIGQLLPELKISDQAIKFYLEKGVFFIALDGLDEVPKIQLQNVENAIADLVKAYPKNYYGLTCRFGATEYVPLSFDMVEIVKWTSEQITSFVKKWFQNSTEKGIAQKFLHELKDSDVASDIASSPMLLTLLCQLYEDGYEFPRHQTELLEDAVDLYIRKWDSMRRIKRDPDFEEKLSRQRRKEIFEDIAYSGMMEDRASWERWQLEEEIRRCLDKVWGVTPESLDTDTSNVLYALEAAHGLLVRGAAKNQYEFSHRSFQEYFMAMKVIADAGRDTDLVTKFLAEHLLDPKFRSPILIVLKRQRNVEPLLLYMREQLSHLVQANTFLNQWLAWLQKTTEVAGVASAAWRSNLLCYDLETPLYLDSRPGIDRRVAYKITEQLREFNQRTQAIKEPTPRILLTYRLAAIYRLAGTHADEQPLEFEALGNFSPIYKEMPPRLKSIFSDLVSMAREVELEAFANSLQDLLSHFPSEADSAKVWKDWAEQLRKYMQKHLSVGYSHKMETKDFQPLNQYIYLTRLVTDTVVGDSQCSPKFRRAMVESLFLPCSN